MNQNDIETYVRSLYKRAHEARVLQRIEVAACNWKAQANMCHHNASELHLRDERYVPVRGWLYFDLRDLGYVKFVSHSAVRTPKGEIVDITPKPEGVTQDYPFLEGNVSENVYQYLVEECGCGEINFVVEVA